MHVPVDDGDLANAVGLLGVACGQGDIVEDTEAHAPRAGCVVPGRTDGAKRIPSPALHHGVHGRERAADGEDGDVQ